MSPFKLALKQMGIAVGDVYSSLLSPKRICSFSSNSFSENSLDIKISKPLKHFNKKDQGHPLRG
jgi:hypothetical protein